jgi:hypothetical protein
MKSREEITNQVAAMIKETKFQYEINEYLKSEGIDESDFKTIKVEAQKIYLSKSTKQRKLVWISFTILTFILFYFLIPNSLYNSFPFIISIAGGVLMTFFLMQSIGDFRSFEEFNTESNEQEESVRKYVPYLIIPGIAFIIIFYMNFSSRQKAELKEYGEKVMGTIVDGSSIKVKRGRTYSVTVRFITKGGKTYLAKETVSEHEFKNFHKGQQVELVYSKKDPFIIDLLTNKKSISEYTGSEEREMKIRDLLKLASGENINVYNFLNNINYGWKFNARDSVWINERTKVGLNIIHPYGLKYLSYSTEFMNFPKELNELGFTRIENEDNRIKVYVKDDYLVSFDTKVSGKVIETITTIQKLSQ